MHTKSKAFKNQKQTLPLTFSPNPIEAETELSVSVLLLVFSFITSSSLETSPEFIFFFFLCRGGSFFGKVNMGNITRSIAMAQRRNPLHLMPGKQEWKQKQTHHVKQKKTKLLLEAAPAGKTNLQNMKN